MAGEMTRYACDGGCIAIFDAGNKRCEAVGDGMCVYVGSRNLLSPSSVCLLGMNALLESVILIPTIRGLSIET